MSDGIMYDSKEDCYMVSEERLEEFEKALKERDELAAELERVKELRDKWYDKFISKNLEYKDLTREMDRVEAERDDARKSADTQCQIRYMVDDELESLKSRLPVNADGDVVLWGDTQLAWQEGKVVDIQVDELVPYGFGGEFLIRSDDGREAYISDCHSTAESCRAAHEKGE